MQLTHHADQRMNQRGISRRLPETVLLELPDCGHSPHRDQPERLIEACTEFIHRHSQGVSP